MRWLALPVAYGAPTGTVAPSHAPRLAPAVARAEAPGDLDGDSGDPGFASAVEELARLLISCEQKAVWP